MSGSLIGKAGNLLYIILQILEELSIINNAIFNNLSQAGINFPLRQGLQRIQIHEYSLGLIKGSNKIFTQRMIYSHLAAYTGIHLSQ